MTRERLLEIAKPRFEWVEVEGFGRIGIRSVGQVKKCRRLVAAHDSKGEIIPEEWAKNPTWQLIDQLMIDDQTPMFTERDFKQVAELDDVPLAALREALDRFNGVEEEEEKKP